MKLKRGRLPPPPPLPSPPPPHPLPSSCRPPSAEWVNNDKKIEGTLSPLSGCQASKLTFTTTNDILIGGNGERRVR